MEDREFNIVEVEKAQLPLAAGESMNDFQKQLRVELQDHLPKKLKLAGKFHLYPMELFGDAAIVEVCQYSKNDGPGDRRFYQLGFQREGLAFKFGEPMEVVRRVTYVPRQGVQKRDSSIWAGVL